MEKEIKEFPKLYKKNKNGNITGDGYRSNCRKCENKRRQKNYHKNPLTRLMMNTKTRARNYGIEFNLEYKDLSIPKYCPILKVKLIKTDKSFEPFAPSIDRIDSSKGYIKGNVKIISFLANRMKNNATKEQCLAFAENIKNYYDDIV